MAVMMDYYFKHIFLPIISVMTFIGVIVFLLRWLLILNIIDISETNIYKLTHILFLHTINVLLWRLE